MKNDTGYLDETVKPVFKHTCKFKNGKCIICGKVKKEIKINP